MFKLGHNLNRAKDNLSSSEPNNLIHAPYDHSGKAMVRLNLSRNSLGETASNGALAKKKSQVPSKPESFNEIRAKEIADGIKRLVHEHSAQKNARLHEHSKKKTTTQDSMYIKERVIMLTDNDTIELKSPTWEDRIFLLETEWNSSKDEMKEAEGEHNAAADSSQGHRSVDDEARRTSRKEERGKKLNMRRSNLCTPVSHTSITSRNRRGRSMSRSRFGETKTSNNRSRSVSATHRSNRPYASLSNSWAGTAHSSRDSRQLSKTPEDNSKYMREIRQLCQEVEASFEKNMVQSHSTMRQGDQSNSRTCSTSVRDEAPRLACPKSPYYQDQMPSSSIMTLLCAPCSPHAFPPSKGRTAPSVDVSIGKIVSSGGMSVVSDITLHRTRSMNVSRANPPPPPKRRNLPRQTLKSPPVPPSPGQCCLSGEKISSGRSITNILPPPPPRPPLRGRVGTPPGRCRLSGEKTSSGRSIAKVPPPPPRRPHRRGIVGQFSPASTILSHNKDYDLVSSLTTSLSNSSSEKSYISGLRKPMRTSQRHSDRSDTYSHCMNSRSSSKNRRVHFCKSYAYTKAS